MPKLKTNRGAKKRFTTTATGKIRYQKSGRRHILTTKGQKRKRHLRRSDFIHATDERRVRALIPYA